MLTEELATRFATSTLGHLCREWPNKLDHVLNGPDDAATPSMLHPVFYGSYDWHSCVHGWWQVMRIARLFPDSAVAGEARALADAMIVPDKIAGEMAYLARPAAANFERPYGWAWALALHGELALHDDPCWAAAIEPLARAFADRFRGFLPKLTYPVRHGIHSNTAFALTLAHEWAVDHDPALAALIEARATHWFANDRGCQVWEPSGEDFLSPALCEATLMARVMPRAAFADWFAAFLPEPGPLLTPAEVSDRSDGRIAHLDGLNFSRAWCWRAVATALGPDHAASAGAEDAARSHITASLPHLADDYMGEHWLATFALLAIEHEPRST